MAEEAQHLIPTGRKWMPFHKEFIASEELLRDSSDEDEFDGSTIHHAFDKMYEHQDGFPFIVGGRNSSVTHHHPSPIHIFQLWQIYINNVNPLLRITHIPTVQGQIIEASSRLEKVSKPIEVLMFAIYLMAVTSMTEDQVQRQFDEEKTILISKYHLALQQALVNAGFMRTNDLTVLQAYMLYLVRVRQRPCIPGFPIPVHPAHLACRLPSVNSWTRGRSSASLGLPFGLASGWVCIEMLRPSGSLPSRLSNGGGCGGPSSHTTVASAR
jgi:hypothetical protein